MNLADVEAAISSISAERDDLQKAFVDLKSCSSPASFTLQWKDIDDHLSSIEKSIRNKFLELKASDLLKNVKSATPLPELIAKEDQYEPENEPRPDVKFLCAKMYGKALRSYVNRFQEDSEAIRRELSPALLLAPNPVTLVLDSLESESLFPSRKITEALSTMLECLRELAPEIRPADKVRARKMAMWCKGFISDDKKMRNLVKVLFFLNLITTFGLTEFLVLEDVMDFLVLLAAEKCTVNICRNSLLEKKVPDLIKRLNKEGREYDSLKFIVGFNLLLVYPLDSLFKPYINRTKRSADQKRRRGSAPIFRREALTKEISCLTSVINAIEEYNLESLYSCVDFRKRIKELENQLVQIKEPPKTRQRPWRRNTLNLNNMQHQGPDKFPQPSSDSTANVVNALPQFQNQPQLGLIGGAPFVGLANPYGFGGAPAFHIHGGASLSGNPVGLGWPIVRPNMFPHPPDSLMGPVYYGGVHSNPGFPFMPYHP